MLKAVSVVIAEGKRPVTFRTRKLSPPAPMVLHSGGCGRVGRRRTQRDRKAHTGTGGAFFCPRSGAWSVAGLRGLADLQHERGGGRLGLLGKHGQGQAAVV